MKIRPLLLTSILVLGLSCKNDGIPELNIYKTGNISWREKRPCKIIYIHANDTTALNGNIKFRGGSSSKYYKHSFSLELNNKYPLAELPGDDDWIINANYIDKTFMRHKISYDFFRAMSKKKTLLQNVPM